MRGRGTRPVTIRRRVCAAPRDSGTASLLADERFIEHQVTQGVLRDRRDLLGVRREPPPEPRLLEEPAELRGQVRSVAGPEEEAVDAAVDRLGHPAVPGRQHGYAGEE